MKKNKIFLNFIRSQKGVALPIVTLMSVMLAGVIYYITQNIQTSRKDEQYMQESRVSNAIITEIENTLSHAPYCRDSFQRNTTLAINGETITGIYYDLVTPSKYLIGASNAIQGIEITSLRIVNVQNVGTPGVKFDLEISLLRNKTNRPFTKRIPIAAEIDSTTFEIQECSSKISPIGYSRIFCDWLGTYLTSINICSFSLTGVPDADSLKTKILNLNNDINSISPLYESYRVDVCALWDEKIERDGGGVKPSFCP